MRMGLLRGLVVAIALVVAVIATGPATATRSSTMAACTRAAASAAATSARFDVDLIAGKTPVAQCCAVTFFGQRQPSMVASVMIPSCGLDRLRSSDRESLLAPSHNLWCNVGDEDIFHCSSGNRPHSVSLSPTGVVTVCDPCAVNAKLFDTGSPVAGSPVLEYGSTNEIGRYRCISRAEGITCTVFLPGKGHGNGFLINAAGVQRIG